MKKIDIVTMGVDKTANSPVVFLRIENTNLIVPIWIGPWEASVLASAIKEEASDRPLTHDMIMSMLEHTGYRISHVAINDFKKNIYYAKVFLSVEDEVQDNPKGEEEFFIDSRPSDAIILAVKSKTSIFIEDSVAFETAVDGSFLKIDDDEQTKKEDIKKFIDTFNIDDLKKKFGEDPKK